MPTMCHASLCKFGNMTLKVDIVCMELLFLLNKASKEQGKYQAYNVSEARVL